jgi:dihydroxyacid dehydratase/phosphogluconate dehydratase
MSEINGAKRLRSREWFDNPDNPGMTARHLERYLNYGLTREELQSGKPLIGIAQTHSGQRRGARQSLGPNCSTGRKHWRRHQMPVPCRQPRTNVHAG